MVNYVRWLANHALGRAELLMAGGEGRGGGLRKTISPALSDEEEGSPHTSKELPNNCLFFFY